MKDGIPTARPSSGFDKPLNKGQIDVVYINNGKVTHEWEYDDNRKDFGWKPVP